MKVISFFALTFSLFFGTAFLILAVNGQETRIGGSEIDRVYHAIHDGLTFLVVLLCIISSIIIIFLYEILIQLKNINNNNNN